MILRKLVELGTQHQSFSVANNVRGTNVALLVTILIVILHCAYYFFVLKTSILALLNGTFIFIYSISLILNKCSAYKTSKVFFFSSIMLHIFVATNIFVTNKSGFHLYFFLVPTAAFLLFDLKDKFEKLSLSFIAIILFLYCENTLNLTPILDLTNEVNHTLYQSVFLINILAVIFVLSIFTKEIEANEAKLTKQATTDSLTGVFNRHYFFERVTCDLALANELSRPFSIILLGFDNFKEINETHGHHIGDLSLIEASNQIKGHCRSQDCFARIGGGEFVIALADTTLHEAKVIAERIQTSIGKHSIKASQNINLICSVSVGVSSKVNDNEQLKELIRYADKALYQAKEQGGNRVVNL